MKDIVVVGGGASGLMVAIVAARRGRSVSIIEYKERVGKKILATGNGRCNYTNSNMDISCFRSDNINFVSSVLEDFSYYDTIDFFMNLGIYPKDINGYIYPNSQQALAVREVLELEALYLGVDIICDIKVEHIKKNGEHFILKTNHSDYKAKKIVLATGGSASKNLGSDGSGFKLAKELGHKIIKPLPALVQLKTDDSNFKMIAGVRSQAYIELYIDDKLASTEIGELQFTKYGVSGIPVFQISRHASKALDKSQKVSLKIDLLYDLDWKATMDLLEKRIIINPYKNIEEIFYGLFNNKLILYILKRTGIFSKLEAKKISKVQLISLVNMIKNFEVDIVETNPFDSAQATCGGIDTTQVSKRTMESKLIPGLYFSGEILDVDGICGGYNLQWAWSSGFLAGNYV